MPELDRAIIAIEGSNAATGNTYMTSSGEAVPYVNFHSGQPDGGSEHCLTLYVTGEQSAMWDYGCQDDRLSYALCELEGQEKH